MGGARGEGRGAAAPCALGLAPPPTAFISNLKCSAPRAKVAHISNKTAI